MNLNDAAIQQAFDAGFTFVVLSSDVFILWKWGEQVRKVAGSFR